MDEIHQLVEETLKMALDFPSVEENDLCSSPTTPGIIYRVDESRSTFTVRCLPTGNIQKGLQNLENGNSNCLKKLRINDESLSVESLRYFETNYIELAEIISDQIANIIFPYEDESSIFNLSTSGIYWFALFGEKTLEIEINTKINRKKDGFINLGPLGDSCIASYRFNCFKKYLREFFPLKEFLCSEKKLHITLSEQANFKIFQNIFLRGEGVTELYELFNGQMDRTSYLFLDEIASLRRWWIEIEALLRH